MDPNIIGGTSSELWMAQFEDVKTQLGNDQTTTADADAVAYLASHKASYMTGSIMNMLGGIDLFVF